jgi:hypothetical protein
MPNNQLKGMLEDLLAALVSEEAKDLWEFAKKSVEDAKSKGAPYHNIQRAKADIGHTSHGKILLGRALMELFHAEF